MANIGEIALYFIYIRDQMKVYHWQTNNYARHKASDTFVDNLTEKMDKFIEVMQGLEDERLVIKKKNNKYLIGDQNDKDIIEVLNKFREWLVVDILKYLNKKKSNADLITIRDEILSDLDQTLYLFTLS
jgi:hypothetical protein